jgi:hypothetical protein
MSEHRYPGPYPIGTIGTVPRAYKGTEGRRNKNKKAKNRENVIHNKIQAFKNTFFFSSTISLPVKCV